MTRAPTIRMLLLLSLTLAGASFAIQTKAHAEPDICYDCDDLPGKTICHEIPCPAGALRGVATSTSARTGLPQPIKIDPSAFKPCTVENHTALCRRGKPSS